MVVKRYFFIQQLCFALCGIDTEANEPNVIVNRPLLTFGPLLFAIAHLLSIIHFAWTNRNDYVEVSDSLTYLFQLVLAIWKILIFLGKRKRFVALINEVHVANFRCELSRDENELLFVRLENEKDVKVCTIYFIAAMVAAFCALCSPIIEAILRYILAGEVVLRLPYKGSYFFDQTQLPGYCLAYVWTLMSVYQLLSITLAMDTLFTWLVSNISVQFQILCHRFNAAAANAVAGKPTVTTSIATQQVLNDIKSCIQYHNQTMEMVKKINDVYGEIIFIKFIISCLEICCLIFRLSRPNESMAAAAYLAIFQLTVAMQLMLYCYNGQRIQTESSEVATQIFFAFEWSQLANACKKLLLLPMMRSQNTSRLRAVFFAVDLSVFLWVFKTAGSLIAALKTLEEKQD